MRQQYGHRNSNNSNNEHLGVLGVLGVLGAKDFSFGKDTVKFGVKKGVSKS